MTFRETRIPRLNSNSYIIKVTTDAYQIELFKR